MFNVNEPTVRDIAFVGKGEIQYTVDGMTQWDKPTGFTIEIKRESRTRWNEPETHRWTYKVGTLSYSINADENGYLNYAAALKSAAEKIELFVGMEDKMEVIFQEGEAQRKAEYEREQAEQAARRDADKPVGEKLAKKMIETMKREVKSMARWDTQNIKCFERGTRREFTIKVEFSRAGLGLFSKDYSRISKKEAIALLADSHLQSLDVRGCSALPDPNVAAFMMSKM
jgi:hypothetical protein